MDWCRIPHVEQWRFFRDTDETTTVVWFPVPEGTPFLPFEHPWCSQLLEADPGHTWELGPVDPLQVYQANAVPPFDYDRVHYCGTLEQWRGRNLTVPDPPIPMRPAPADMVPQCCTEKPPPPPLPRPFLWVKPGGIASMSDGGFIDNWLSGPEAEGGLSATTALPPTKETIGGVPYALFLTGPLVGGAMAMTAVADPPPENDITLHIVSMRRDFLTPSGPHYGNLTLNTAVYYVQHRDIGAFSGVTVPAFAGEVTPVVDQWELFTLIRSGTTAKLYRNGGLIAEALSGVLTTSRGIGLRCHTTAIGANRSGGVAEVKGYRRASSVEELAADWAAFSADYGIVLLG